MTRIAGGIADNVDPRRGGRARQLPLRPGAPPHEAEAWLRELCKPHGTLRSAATRPAPRCAVGNPMAQRLIATGDLAVEAEQAWTPVAEFAAAGVDAINFGPGDPAQAHARDEHVRDRRARALLRDDRGLRVRLNPVLAGMTSYPFLAWPRPSARRSRAESRSSTSASASRARSRRPSSAGARAGARRRARLDLPAGRGAARAARGGRRVDAAALRRGPRPRHRGHPDQGSKEAIFHLAQVVAAHGDRVVITAPGYPVASARRAVRRRVGGRGPARPRARLAARPRGGRLGRRRAAVAELPQQPDGGDGDARALRARRGAGARARLRPRLRRGLLGAVVRWRPAGQRAAARRPPQRRRLQHALQALLDARLPLRLRGRRPRDHRGAAGAFGPNVGVAPQTFIQRAAVAAWATRSTSSRSASATGPSATRCCRRCCDVGLRAVGRRRLVLPVAARARAARTPRPSRCACSSEHGIAIAPGSYFGPAGGATCASRSCPPRGLSPRRRRA